MAGSEPPPAGDLPRSGGSGQGRRLFRNTALNGLGVVVALAVNFLLLPFEIHHVGRAAYGIWVLVTAFSLSDGYFSLADLGLELSIVKLVAEAEALGDRRRTSEIVSSSLFLLAGVGLLCLVALFGIGLLASRLFTVPAALHTSLRVLFWLLAGELGAGLPGLAFLGVLEGVQRYPAIRAIDMARQLTNAAIVVIGLLSGHGVLTLGVALALSASANALAYYIVARRRLPGLQISIKLVRRVTLRPLFSFGGWVFVSRIEAELWSGMDPLILAVLLSSSVLAGYAVAQKVGIGVGAIIAFTSSALLPAASALHAARNKELLRELLVRGTRYAIMLALPIVIGAWVMARSVVVHWVGPRFAGVTTPTRLFVLLELLSAAVSVANIMLIGIGRVREVTLALTAAVITNLVVSLALARPFGISGVIAGTIAGYVVVGPLYLRLILRELDLRLWSFMKVTYLPQIPWAIAFAVLAIVARQAVPTHDLVEDVLICAPAFAVYVLGIGRFVMTSSERTMLFGFFRRGLRPQSAELPEREPGK